MAVSLYPHNQTAYKNALHLMEESGRAAVVHPTGTGKSFIAFKLAEEHPGKIVIWLAPSEYIFRSQRENYLKAGGDEAVLSGITFLTYAKLMYSMMDFEDSEAPGDAGKSGKPDSVEGAENTADHGFEKTAGPWKSSLPFPKAPDYIVLDEFHRCGAESWGRCVGMLMEAYPDAKVLGLSATNIRYLDSRRDMAGELFGGRIASRMELAEAVSKGILPAPLYICGMYEYRDELRKISRRVNRQRNVGVRDESAKLLEKLRHCLQQADGPAEIFARHMKKDGKYIVFCSGREHMEEMIALVGKWYGALDKNPTVYCAVYDNTKSAEEVRSFSADQSNHLKLLFCIDMLNEGVHVADADGAVLLRPTASPTLYLQQVGRALSVPDKNDHSQPMIFDMVDNFDSLKCIDSFLEAYHRAGSEGSREKEKSSYEFRLIDEARDSRMLFDRLGKCLSSSWEMCFEEAESYYRLHGNLKVSKRYITESGIALGSWLITQRRVRAGAVPGNLSKEQIKKLDGLGMEWESRIGKAWETGYQELVKYHEENGHLDVPCRYITEDGYPLGRFVSNQRTAWKNGRKAAEAGSGQDSNGFEANSSATVEVHVGRTLSAERRRRLDALGFIWEKPQQSWNRYYGAAKAFYKREGHLDVPAKYVTEDGLRLGAWIQNKTTNRNSLSEEQIQALEDIGMNWGGRYDARWNEKFQLAEQYYQEHGNLEVPKEYTVQGVRLGRWVNALRSARVRPDSCHYRLDAERIRRLDSIGMRWAGKSWEIRYQLAKSYYEEHGDLRISQTYVAEADEERIWLGKWLAAQRKKRNHPGGKHALTKEQERRLEAIGIEW